MIHVENLSKNYGNFQAVKNIGFTVEKGEIFGFLGPNGAGKTTTINMLTGLAVPTSGYISIAGRDGLKDMKKIQEHIGIVPDESNLYDDMSGYENLVFCASLYGMPKKDRNEKALELLEMFSLEDTGNRPFKAYSKGMKRKLTIAAGIIHDPEILFLDEPTTGIDVESARQIRKLIKDLNRNGTTIFLTTHYIEDAERLCQRIGFIANGEVIKVSKVFDLLKEAQKELIMEFSVDRFIPGLKEFLQESFPNVNLKHLSDKKIRIGSSKNIELMPYMVFFDEKGITVNEARIIRPSLEEVFVEVTGIEIHKLKKEKNGKNK